MRNLKLTGTLFLTENVIMYIPIFRNLRTRWKYYSFYFMFASSSANWATNAGKKEIIFYIDWDSWKSRFISTKAKNSSKPKENYSVIFHLVKAWRIFSNIRLSNWSYF